MIYFVFFAFFVVSKLSAALRENLFCFSLPLWASYFVAVKMA